MITTKQYKQLYPLQINKKLLETLRTFAFEEKCQNVNDYISDILENHTLQRLGAIDTDYGLPYENA